MAAHVAPHPVAPHPAPRVPSVAMVHADALSDRGQRKPAHCLVAQSAHPTGPQQLASVHLAT
eukprot:3398851-Rhodomonas_salina.1